MSRLGLFIAGFIFLAAAGIVFFNDWNWQSALILAAVGGGILFFLIKG